MPNPVNWSAVNTNRVQFRANKGLPATDGLLARTSPTSGDLSGTTLRDISRYYALLAGSAPTLGSNEAKLVMDALNGSLMTNESIRLVWAEVDDAIRHDGLDRKWGVQGEELVEYLRSLSLAETFALVDCIERAWLIQSQPDAPDLEETLQQVGLVRDDR